MTLPRILPLGVTRARQWSTNGLKRYTSFGCGFVASCRSLSRTPMISPTCLGLSHFSFPPDVDSVDGSFITLGEFDHGIDQLFKGRLCAGLRHRQVRHLGPHHLRGVIGVDHEILAGVPGRHGHQGVVVRGALLDYLTIDAADEADIHHRACSITTREKAINPEPVFSMLKLWVPA